VFHAGAYLASFAWRAGVNASNSTVDLSRGRKPGLSRQEYAVWTYLLTAEETQSALKRSSEAGLSVTENLCRVMAIVLLEAQPQKSRVCISVPTDLSAYAATFSPETPGNFTGSLIVQLWRGRPLDVQVRRAFQWARHGVHYWTPWLLGRTAGKEARLTDRFLRQAQQPVPARAPFENFSCAVSSVGVIQGRYLQQYLASISATTRTQTIFLCAITLNGCMSVEVSVSHDLYNSIEVAVVTDRAVALLTGMQPDQASTKRTDVCRGREVLTFEGKTV
jgi:hypothetical protein